MQKAVERSEEPGPNEIGDENLANMLEEMAAQVADLSAKRAVQLMAEGIPAEEAARRSHRTYAADYERIWEAVDAVRSRIAEERHQKRCPTCNRWGF